MPATDLALSKLQEDLADPGRHISPLDLQRMINELKRLLSAATSEGVVVHANALLGLAYQRKGDDDAALQYARIAFQRHPNATDLANNYATSLLRAGRTEEALEILFKVAKRGGDGVTAVKANLALALLRLGLAGDGERVLRDACEDANYDDALSVIALATCAAEFGFSREAVELFARYLQLRYHVSSESRSAIEVVDAAPAGALAFLSHWRHLAVALAQQRLVLETRRLLPHEQAFAEMESPIGNPDADASAVRILDELEDARAAATSAVCSEAPDGE